VLILATIAAALVEGGRWWLLVYVSGVLLFISTTAATAHDYLQRRSAKHSAKPS
jgi:hypothetical protein